MVVRTRQGKKRFLWAVNAVALAGIAAAWWAPPGEPRARARELTAASRPAAAPAPPPRPLSDYAAIWTRPLRQPLFDPKPVAAAAAPASAPKPTLAAILTGTAVGPGQAFATFRSALGEQQLLGVGESIDGATIVAIREDSVTVQFNGEAVQLKVQAPKEEP